MDMNKTYSINFLTLGYLSPPLFILICVTVTCSTNLIMRSVFGSGVWRLAGSARLLPARLASAAAVRHGRVPGRPVLVRTAVTLADAIL